MTHTAFARAWKLDTTTSLLFVIASAIAFAAMRAVGTLGPTGLQFLLPVGFVLMSLAPWIFLSRDGRRAMGLQKATSSSIYLPAIGLGAIAALGCFLLGLALFGTSADNWFVTIAVNFDRSVPDQLPVMQLYLMFTVTAMIFSPIGEEIFFRGLLQSALETRLSPTASTWVECLAFGTVHLCHHGVVLSAAGIGFLPRSAPVWFALMAAAGYLFAWLRARSRSLYPAIAAHVAFNFTMGTCIFAGLWPVSA